MRLQNFGKLTFMLLAGLMASCSGGNEDEPTNYALRVSATDGGTVTTAKGSYAVDEQVSVTAVANEGYLFSGWYENEELISTENQYSFAMPARDVSLLAQFESESFLAADAVDLGLSVKWASWNVGASAPEEYGGLYGWADPTGEKRTVEVNDYPGETPPANISGTEYDIARTLWGEGWRLPTQTEFQELVDNCTWEWAEVNGVNGRRATGTNGNSVFFPAAASRTGEELSDQVGQRGCYWTGTLYTSNSNFAYYFYFYSGNQYANRNNRRYFGYSIRPVTE